MPEPELWEQRSRRTWPLVSRHRPSCLHGVRCRDVATLKTVHGFSTCTHTTTVGWGLPCVPLTAWVPERIILILRMRNRGQGTWKSSWEITRGRARI